MLLLHMILWVIFLTFAGVTVLCYVKKPPLGEFVAASTGIISTLIGVMLLISYI